MEMVERVARAIAAVSHPGDGDYLWDAYLAEARAAIEAMVEPTDDMIEEGSYSLFSTLNGAEGCWSAMINAAIVGLPK